MNIYSLAPGAFQWIPDIYLVPKNRQAIVFAEMRNSATEGRRGEREVGVRKPDINLMK